MSTPVHSRPLITTGRTASRLKYEEKQSIISKLQSHALPTPLPQPLEVELGIGNGDAMHARALANPSWHFLGSEIYLNGLKSLLHTLKQQPAGNLSLTNTDARTLLQTLPPASVQRLLILFPDPWPKASHHKRRLLQPELLTAAARVVKPNGELWVVTDWPDYAYHTLAQLHTHPSWQLAQTGLAARECQVKPETRSTTQPRLGPQTLATAPTWWVPTKYQAKAAAQGREPWFIGAVRVAEK
jgi:tRNA (guanine-N7-)-methyltransferase